MAYFRTLPKLPALFSLFSKDDRWLILINADPDAMAASLALKKIMSARVKEIGIAKINQITRPDNLAMGRYCRIPMADISPDLLEKYDKFAMVDSQPHHNEAFANIPFSIIIDHHPLPEKPFPASYTDIRPEYGSTSTMMTEYLYNLHTRPGKLLATALQFGIRTDTGSFERYFFDVDMRAYQYLARFADKALLSRIMRSEFHKAWLQYFAKAYTNMYSITSGEFSFLGTLNSPDILVIVADLFMRVYEIQWVAIAGIVDKTAIVIFRGYGQFRDLGKIANKAFGDIGSAGGHKTMARAEFPIDAAKGDNIELFIWNRLTNAQKRSLKTIASTSTAEEHNKNSEHSRMD